MLLLAERLPAFENLKSEISNLKLLAEEISRQLRGWADSLQNSAIRGQRHLNEQTRHKDQQDRRANQFWQRLEAEHRQRLERQAGARTESPDENTGTPPAAE